MRGRGDVFNPGLNVTPAWSIVEAGTLYIFFGGKTRLFLSTTLYEINCDLHQVNCRGFIVSPTKVWPINI